MRYLIRVTPRMRVQEILIYGFLLLFFILCYIYLFDGYVITFLFVLCFCLEIILYTLV